MPPTQYTIATLAERPDLTGPIDDVASVSWPEFMLQDPITDRFWGQMITKFPGHQFALLDPESGAVAAMGNSVPFRWEGDIADLPGGGWDWVMEHACTGHDAGLVPNLVSAIQIVIAPDYRGRGVSQHAVNAMRQIARRAGFDTLVAPVRPNVKAQYPLMPMERYITWKRPDGLPFDAWLRVHARIGAEIVKVAPESMLISGTVAQWEAWTGMLFPESGAYVIPGALNPVQIDRAQDRGTYTEPNVWMRHALNGVQG